MAKNEEMLGKIITKLVEVPGKDLGTIYDLLEKVTGKNKENQMLQLRKNLRGENLSKALEDQIGAWRILYNRFFGFELDFTDLNLPKERDGFDQLIIVPKGLKTEMV